MYQSHFQVVKYFYKMGFWIVKYRHFVLVALSIQSVHPLMEFLLKSYIGSYTTNTNSDLLEMQSQSQIRI